MEEKISIVMTSYNYAKYIGEAIQSVIDQTYKNWELIVFDDGSTDNSINIIQEYSQKDARIKFFQHANRQNKGLPETVKQAIYKTTSNWIVFLESDDSLTNDYIEEKIKVIEKYPEIGFIFNDVNIYGDFNQYEQTYSNVIKPTLKNLEYPILLLKTFQQNFGCNMIPTFSVVMVKASFIKNLKFNTPIKQYIDWYLWLQIINQNKCLFYFIDKKLTNWRRHNDSYVSAKLDKKEQLLFNIKQCMLLKKQNLIPTILYQQFIWLLRKLFKFIKNFIYEHKISN